MLRLKKLSLYEKWKLNNLLAEKVIEVGSPEFLMRVCEVDENEIRKVQSAGFKSLVIGLSLLKEGISLERVMEVKRRIMEMGEENEEEAEYQLWNFREDLDFLLYCYERIKGPRWTFSSLLIDYKDKDNVEKALTLLEESGLSHEEAVQELWYFPDIFRYLNATDFFDEFSRQIKVLRKHRLKSFCSYPPLMKDPYWFKERFIFFRSLGLEDIKAEWWTGLSYQYGVLVEKEDVLFWKDKAENKNLLGLSSLFRDLAYLLEDGLSLEEIRKWQSEGLNPVWALYGFTIEDAKAWKDVCEYCSTAKKLKDRISPQKFLELQKKSHDNPEDFANWLLMVDFDLKAIEDWFEVGIKNYEIAKALMDKGISTAEDFRNLLSCFSFREILNGVERGMHYEDFLTMCRKLL